MGLVDNNTIWKKRTQVSQAIWFRSWLKGDDREKVQGCSKQGKQVAGEPSELQGLQMTRVSVGGINEMGMNIDTLLYPSQWQYSYLD